MKRILVLGASGLIGTAICEALSTENEVYGTYFFNKTKPAGTMMVKLDIGDEGQLNNVLETVEPELVISSLRGDFAYQLAGHKVLADYLNRRGVRLIYLSTVNVFDAITDKAHTESDEVLSNSDYGEFKIKCEHMLQTAMGQLLTILRLPMVFGKNAKRVLEIKEGLKKGGPLIMYSDLYLNFHSDKLLAKQIEFLIAEEVEGILHLGSYDVVAYKTMMSLLVKKLGYKGIHFQFERIQDQPYYLALTTERDVFPINLIYSVDQVVASLM